MSSSDSDISDLMELKPGNKYISQEVDEQGRVQYIEYANGSGALPVCTPDNQFIQGKNLTYDRNDVEKTAKGFLDWNIGMLIIPTEVNNVFDINTQERCRIEYEMHVFRDLTK